MKRILSVLLAAVLSVAPAFADVKPLKGFDKKVYDGSFALYASSHQLGVRDRFICSAQAIKKVDGGYFLLSAGHCTPANTEELPPDMEFSVAEDLGGDLTPVVLVQAALESSTGLDYSEFYLRTNKQYPVMELGDESDAHLGDKTVDVNFSLGLAKYVSYGRVSSEVSKGGEAKGRLGVDQFDSHGASGSSVVDERTKKVIGIVVAGVDGATTATWVEPISRIKKILAQATLPRSTRPYVVPQHKHYVAEPEIPAATFPEAAPSVGAVQQVKED